jgi:hypothetical protein
MLYSVQAIPYAVCQNDVSPPGATCVHGNRHPDRTTEPQVHALRPSTDQGLGFSSLAEAGRFADAAEFSVSTTRGETYRGG